MQHNLDDFDLVIFGDFGVLTTTPFREPDGKLAMLPGRVAFLAQLREDRERRGLAQPLLYAVTGNKGGVAFCLGTEAQARAELEWTVEQIDAEAYAVCFAHPKPAAGYERYADPEQLKRRKPAPGMLNEIVTNLGIPRDRVLVVGNYADDCRAAQAAGLAHEGTATFFAAMPNARPVARDASSRGDDFDLFFDK